MATQSRDRALVDALVECLIGIWQGLPELPQYERTVVAEQLEPILQEGPTVTLSPHSGLSLLPPIGLAWMGGLGRTLERWENLDSKQREAAANVLLVGPMGQYEASREATEITFLDQMGVPRSDETSMGST